MLFILLSFIFLLAGLIYLKYKSEYWKKRGVIQFNYIFFRFIWSKRSLAEIYKNVYDEYHKESYIGTFLGLQPALIIKNVEDVQVVMQSNFENFHSRGINFNPNDVLADNVLFINNYRRWKLLRHKLSPVFTSMKIKNMFFIMERCARDFVEYVNNKPDISENSFNALYTYTTASIAASIFGIDTHTQNTMDSPFLKMTRETTEPSFANNLKFSLSSFSPTIFNFLNLKQFGKYEDFFIGFVKKVLKSRRNEEQKRHDFADTCLELQKQGTMRDLATGYEIDASDEILAAQAFFFFVAGTDTSATVMHFALLELAANQDILKRLHKEIDKVFDECNEKLSYEDIDKLEYLDMVVSETMRKYPPIGAIQRICTKSTVLPYGQVPVNSREVIVIPVYALHRDERYFPNPNLFDPERFAPENLSKIVKFSYLPFGEGNRMCIVDIINLYVREAAGNCLYIEYCLGTRFARVQVKSGLAWLLRRFTLKEQKYEPKSFDPSFFSIKHFQANFELIPRN